MRRTTILSAMLFAGLLVVIIARPVSAAIDTKMELVQGGYYIEYFEFSNRTEASAERQAQTRLVLFREHPSISFMSENPCSLYILNETEMLNLVSNAPFVAKKAWTNITSHQELVQYQKLTEEYGVETYLVDKPGGQPTMMAAMYFAVVNEADDHTQFSLRVAFANPLVTFFEDFFRIVVSFVFFYFGVKLLRDARQASRENLESKKHVYKNYGIAFFFGVLTTSVWEVYHWYARLDVTSSWLKPLEFARMPDLPLFTANILSFVTFVSLGFSIIFMSNTVERMVQSKKVPILTYLLLAVELLMVACIFVPDILLYVFFAWIGVLFLAAINILLTYIKIARITSGALKRQAIWITTCLVALYLSISLGRTLVTPEILGNVLSTIFIIGLYNSLRVPGDVRKLKESPQVA